MLIKSVLHCEGYQEPERLGCVSRYFASLRSLRLIILSSQSLQRRHVIAHALLDIVCRLVTDIFSGRRNIEDTIALFASSQFARTGTKLDAMIREQLRRCVQEITRRDGFASADIKSPFHWRRRFERQINGAPDIADVNCVVELIASLWNDPLGSLARLFDELPVKR